MDPTSFIASLGSDRGTASIIAFSFLLVLLDLRHAWIQGSNYQPMPFWTGGRVTKAIKENWDAAGKLKLFILIAIPVVSLWSLSLNEPTISILSDSAIVILLVTLFIVLCGGIAQYLLRLIVSDQDPHKIANRFRLILKRLNERRLGLPATFIFLPLAVLSHTSSLAIEACRVEPSAVFVNRAQSSELCIRVRQLPNISGERL